MVATQAVDGGAAPGWRNGALLRRPERGVRRAARVRRGGRLPRGAERALQPATHSTDSSSRFHSAASTPPGRSTRRARAARAPVEPVPGLPDEHRVHRVRPAAGSPRRCPDAATSGKRAQLGQHRRVRLDRGHVQAGAGAGPR